MSDGKVEKAVAAASMLHAVLAQAMRSLANTIQLQFIFLVPRF